ncbi:Steryl-sulfatase [Amphibalanus amphitrite]|uniref:Steryl-sulfatase n=1 Tax=Amphibalanus amphitrite TaxID=1232801 RepID=A0A6A4VEY2_AMPAM|nr:Steryl-sulfatase [Amphibalanus amphitrite]
MVEGRVLVFLVLLGCINATKRPNVLVLMVDDLGYGDVGCYDNVTIKTPNIDSLASDGARFTQALAAASTCTPSRAAFLTARYPVRQGMSGGSLGREVILFTAQKGGLPQTEVTLGKVLLEQGYNTSYVGKWHLGVSCERYGDNCHTPMAHGFQYWYGMPMTNVKDFGDDGESVVSAQMPNFFRYLYAVLSGSCLAALVLRSRSRFLFFLMMLVALLATLILLFISCNKIFNSMIMKNGEVVEQPIRLVGLAQRFVAETKEKLAEFKKQKQPFFHIHAFSKVHTFLATVPEFRGKSRHGLYGDSVLELDWAVGEILSELRRLGLADDTIVYLTSDNGGHLEERGAAGDVQGGYNGPLRGGKLMGAMEGGIRVPTLLRYPPLVRPGTTIDAPVSLMDLFPTVLNVAGIDVKSTPVGDRTLDGRDLTPLLTGRADRSPHEFLFHYCTDVVHAVRWMENASTTWKVQFYLPNWLPGTERCHFACLCSEARRLETPLIYNIQQDISERRPLPVGSEQYRRVLERCQRARDEHLAGVEPVPDQLTWSQFIWRPSLQPCCTLPYCTCEDPKYPQPY